MSIFTLTWMIISYFSPSPKQPSKPVTLTDVTLADKTQEAIQTVSTLKQTLEQRTHPSTRENALPSQAEPSVPRESTKIFRDNQDLKISEESKTVFAPPNELEQEPLVNSSTSLTFLPDLAPTSEPLPIGSTPSTESPNPYEENPDLLPQVEAKAIFSVPKKFQSTTVREVKQKTNQKVIALTFDDGPWDKTTEQVLEILKKNNIKATFFWIGKHLQLYPDIGKKVVAEGHAVANHTWNHWFHSMNEATAAFEIDKTAELIYKITGVKTAYFRPPGGRLENGLAAYAQKKKYAVIMWSVDSRDSNPQRPTQQTLVDTVLKNAKPGGIILLHDGGGNHEITVQALPLIINGLKKQGYTFVTVPEMLAKQEPPAETQPSPTPPATSTPTPTEVPTPAETLDPFPPEPTLNNLP